MIQLAFEPALDPFNTMFRLLRLRESIRAAKRLERDHVRIMDFYLVFPFRISGLTVQQKHRRFRSLAVLYQNKKPYGDIPEDTIIFKRMAPFHETAFQSLTSGGFFEGEAFDAGWITPTEAPVPTAIDARIREMNTGEKDLIEFMTVLATEYSLIGHAGLKQRSSLLEHRYDAV